MRLFKDLAFADTRSSTKQVYQQDLARFFVVNNLILEPQKVDFFYKRFVGPNQAFDLQFLAQFVTSCKR